MRWPWALILGLQIAACGATQTPSPQRTYAQLAELIRARRDADAYALLSEDLRAQVSLESFTASIDAERENVAARAERLATQPATTTASVQTRRIEPVTLTMTDDGWRIEGGVSARASTRTPQDAALAFAQALRDQDLQRILRLLSRARREEISSEMQRIVTALQREGELDIVMRGHDHATLRIADGDTIELVLEGGEWRVEDLR